MFVYQNDNSCYLLQMSDVNSSSPHEVVQRNYPVLQKVKTWATDFLSVPNKDLGRKGPVCPFVKGAMDKELFWLTVFENHDATLDEIYKTAMKYKDWFLEIKASADSEEIFKTILILFPHFSTPRTEKLIEKAQEKLKPQFVQEGLMIGQFHPHCEEPGIRNRWFRPLKSEIPLLALRNMVPTDYPFLEDEAAFRESYIKRFGTSQRTTDGP